MAFDTKDSFTFDFTAQADYPDWTPLQSKQYLNARAEELRLAFNTLVEGINEQIPFQTTTNLTYYVDVTLGDDANTGLSAGAGNAFKTIAYAMGKIPRIVDHAVIINVASGDYSGESYLYLSGKSGSGSISITGGADATAAPSYIVRSLTIRNCACTVTIKGLAATTASLGAFANMTSSVVTFTYCVCTTATAGHGFTATGGGTYSTVSYCIVSNLATGGGIRATGGAVIYSDSNSGTGNQIGLKVATAGTIVKNGTQPDGSTAEESLTGGLIR